MIEGFKVRLAVVAVAGVLAVSALGGCAGPSQSSSSESSLSASEASESASSSSEEPDAIESADLVFGDASDEAAVVVLTNETGSAIEGVSVALAASGAEPAALASDAAAWAPGESAAVYFGPAESGAYDVTLSIGGAAYVLHAVDVDAIDEAEVRVDDGVAYLTYEVSGSPVSTLQDEADIAAAAEAEAAAAAEAEAAAAAEAEAAAAAEAEAAAAAEAEAAAAEQAYSYDNAGTAQPAQSEDSCVDGGVVLR